MTMRTKALTDKIFVLGVDGMDPRYTNKMLREGKMPNFQKLLDRGAAREDLMLLGGHPTVTPPMWTTLSTGCYANVHGITGYFRNGSEIDKILANFDSRKCEAEPVWNILAENGIKTAVVHWPGSSWPPTSDSENLYVLDGSTPGALGMSTALTNEYMVVADTKIEQVTFAPSATADLEKACIVRPEDNPVLMQSAADAVKDVAERTHVLLNWTDGLNAECIPEKFTLGLSPITEPSKWAIDVPEGAKEFTMLMSEGRLRCVALILKNEEGVYDKACVYKNKKATEPFAVLTPGKMEFQILGEAITSNDERKDANYNMKIVDLKEDGSHVAIYVSCGMDMHGDFIFSPKELFYELAENVGYIPPYSYLGNHEALMITDCMLPCWDHVGDWQSRTIHYLIEKKGCKAIFSHMHSIDMQEHRFIRYMTKGDKDYDIEFGAKDEAQYRKFMEDIYIQLDHYIGTFLHLLDEGWTILVVSDHAQVCPPHRPPALGDPQGVNVGVMRDLGYTVLKKDAEGNDIAEIDWTKTRAIANRETHIYLNIKGRDKHTLPDGTVIDGIVEPEDAYELEEQIMTDLYGYHDPKTGHRIVALALRNKDAVLFGLGGPQSGDIVYFIAEGYNIDHADGLSTAYGDCETSLSPIFAAAGAGIKEGFKTDRWIREVDVAPTIAALMNVRMPAQCEGAPAYQIFTEEF